MPSPLIIITNDDGIESPGLRAVVEALVDLGELLIVAPRGQQTSMSRAYRGRGRAKPFDYIVKRKHIRAFAVATSPAVTVRHAILLLADRTPDIVVSGINYGENIGSGITISGTVGAALEAAALGVPAVASSTATPLEYHRTHSTEIDFAMAASRTRRLVMRILKTGMPDGVDVLNLNVPQAASVRTPWRWTCVSRHAYFRANIVETGRGRRFSGYQFMSDLSVLEPNSDIQAILVDRVVSVTPLTIDITAPVAKSRLEDWHKGR